MNTELLLERIKILCDKKGITLNTAFVESGVGKNFKSNLKYANPSEGKITMLSNYFGVNVAYLKGETDTVGETIRGEITDAERKLLEAYRAHPEMHDAINKLLSIGSS